MRSFVECVEVFDNLKLFNILSSESLKLYYYKKKPCYKTRSKTTT